VTLTLLATTSIYDDANDDDRYDDKERRSRDDSCDHGDLGVVCQESSAATA
jgi:hypothetical protein